MQGVDTNILVRFFTADDPEQFELARQLVAGADDGELFVDMIVLVELNWTLRRVYGYGQTEVLDLLEELIGSREFSIANADLVSGALTAARAAGCDFADALIALGNAAAGCQHTRTFDKTASRLEQMVALERRV